MGRWGNEIVRYKYRYKYGIDINRIIMFHVKHIARKGRGKHGEEDD